MSIKYATGTKEFPYYTVGEVADLEGVSKQRLRQRSAAGWRGFPTIIPVAATLGVISMAAYGRWLKREEKAGNR